MAAKGNGNVGLKKGQGTYDFAPHYRRASRVGDGSSMTLLHHNGIVVFDMSNVDGGTHSVFASLPTLMKFIKEGTLSHSILAGNIANPEDIILARSSSILEEATSLILYMPIRIFSLVHKRISSISQ